jgi:hypothetical protein
MAKRVASLFNWSLHTPAVKRTSFTMQNVSAAASAAPMQTNAAGAPRHSRSYNGTRRGQHGQRGQKARNAGKCYTCGELGHMRSECSAGTGRTGAAAHFSTLKPTPPAAKNARKVGRCYTCGELGHMRNECNAGTGTTSRQPARSISTTTTSSTTSAKPLKHAGSEAALDAAQKSAPQPGVVEAAAEIARQKKANKAADAAKRAAARRVALANRWSHVPRVVQSMRATTFTRIVKKEEIGKLAQFNWKGQINLIDNAQACHAAVGEIRASLAASSTSTSTRSPLGFDTETKPQFQKGGGKNKICLIQLATLDQAWLFRLHKMPLWQIPPPLWELLCDESVVKVGLGLENDVPELSPLAPTLTALPRVMLADDRNFCDVASLAKFAGFELTSMRNLAAILFERRVTKTQQTSDWEAPHLTPAQQRYAAIDAVLPLRFLGAFASAADKTSADFL